MATGTGPRVTGPRVTGLGGVFYVVKDPAATRAWYADVLADGRRIVLKRDWHGGDAATREFLRVVHKSACKRFGTVLGPEYNAAHEDHFHLEGSGGTTFCR